MGLSNINNNPSSKGDDHSVVAAKASFRSKPSSSKNSAGTNAKKIRFHSNSCNKETTVSYHHHKLDATIPQQAHKIQQRKKAIIKGKNTIGYDEYRRQVPKPKRKQRCMETPSTPDPTLDIPNKQWNGMVKAWRIALHKYDPVDLQQAFEESEQQANASITPPPVTTTTTLSVKEQELQYAQSQGLLDYVQVTTTVTPTPSQNNNNNNNNSNSKDDDVSLFWNETIANNTSPLMVMADDRKNNNNNEMSILDEWERQAQRRSNDDDDDDDDISVLDSVGEESDDDLL